MSGLDDAARRALVRLLWRSVADQDDHDSCEPDDRLDICDAWQALGFGDHWPGAEAAANRLSLAKRAELSSRFRHVTGAIGDAVFSLEEPTPIYRYSARYTVGLGADPRMAAFVMLNPSTADQDQLDPTLRRCRGFALREGCDRMTIVNLYAWRATDPADMWRAADPIGPGNDEVIAEVCRAADLVICGWGGGQAKNAAQRERFTARAARVRSMLREAGVELHHLGLTNGGQPTHPLYLPGATPVTRWT